MHLVLLRYTSRHEMDHAWSITFHLELTGTESPLLSHENMKVIVRSVNASVSLGSKWRTEDNKVFCDARVDDVHRAHGTTSIVKDPLAGVRINLNLCCWIRGCKVRNNMLDHSRRIIWGGRNGVFREFMKLGGVEHIPAGLVYT